MLLFLDFEGVLIHRTAGATGSRKALLSREQLLGPASALVDTLGEYLDYVDVVVSSPCVQGRSLEEVKGLLPPSLARRVIGSIWARPPPRPLSRYGHLRYWLHRNYVLRPPSWLALVSSACDWPEPGAGRLVYCTAPITTEGTQRALRAALARYDWSELWWGEGEAPPLVDRDRARSLMSVWSVPRKDWPGLLGTNREVFTDRLDLLLTIYAGAAPRVETSEWYPHWVHLPKRELDLRRPLEVMMTEGLTGIHRVLELVWQE